VQVSVAADGRYSVNQQPVAGQSVVVLAAALREAAGGARAEDVALIVSADAMATHQSVVNVMDAARRAGLPQLSFATQSNDGSAP
jgi:biopolymer transport protein ExbD